MLLQSIELENLLSFKHIKLKLEPLNVLIGANASGKSNLIRALGLAKSLPEDLQGYISQTGGPLGWINRRERDLNARITLELPQAAAPNGGEPEAPVYSLAFRMKGEAYEIVREEYSGAYKRRPDHSVVLQAEPIAQRVDTRPAALRGRFQVQATQTVLSQIRHPSEPKIGELAANLGSIRLYQEFQTGPRTTTRLGINASAAAEYLSEEGGNLALVLSRLMNRFGQRDRINKYLSKFFPLFAEVATDTPGGIAQIYVREKEVSDAFSAVSLSDGTLRLLCLLAVLLDPRPPKLVCIEEPEVGLHPDAIRMIAELLVEASTRTQLVVTTHSPTLIDALTSKPESVVVCERDFDGFTQLRRLQKSEMETWLDEYSLGDLWQKGEIGGNRW